MALLLIRLALLLILLASGGMIVFIVKQNKVVFKWSYRILLAGFICGPVSGMIVGLLAPVLSFALTGMPPAYAVPLMTIELCLYGLAAGWLTTWLL